MDDVARRAGLSRITVYRRLVSKEALVEAVPLRDFRQYVDRFLADIAGADTVADRVVVAELMVRLSASFFLSPSEVIDLDDDGQVAAIARRYLVPMLTGD